MPAWNRIPDSDFSRIGSGAGNTSSTVMLIKDLALFEIAAIRIHYLGQADETLAFWDDADGTAVGDLSDQREEIELTGQGRLDFIKEFDRWYENDVIVETVDGNQDGDIIIEVEGEHIISGRPAAQPRG